MSRSNGPTALWRWVRDFWTRGPSTPPPAALSAPSVSASLLELPGVTLDQPPPPPPPIPIPLPLPTAPSGQLPGRLIIVEGIDGSGKSTQLDLLRKWLVNQGYLVIFSEWNSSPIVKGITRRGKRQQTLSPMSFSLIHAADFASRTYSTIMPALQSGAIVLADRYVYTAYARDAVRGVNRAWLRRLYSFAVPPTLAFYFDVPLDEAMKRIAAGRPELKYYEAGLDLGLATDQFESFRLFQGLIRAEYEQVVGEFGLVRMRATDSLVAQQQRMREIVRPYIEGALRQPTPATEDAVRVAGLLGHQRAERGALEPPG
jgi:dTMP kinase